MGGAESQELVRFGSVKSGDTQIFERHNSNCLAALDQFLDEAVFRALIFLLFSLAQVHGHVSLHQRCMRVVLLWFAPRINVFIFLTVLRHIHGFIDVSFTTSLTSLKRR